MAQNTEPMLIKIKDAAVLLGISEWQVRRLIEAGELPSTRISNRLYLPLAAIKGYVDSIRESA